MPKGTPPPQITPVNDDQYFEEISKAVFRSGFSWAVVENKWPNFQRAFKNFSIDAVADFDEMDFERLVADEGIIRNGRKIEATMKNAQAMMSLRDQFGSFRAYLRSMDNLDYGQISKDIQKRFSHLGRTGTYTFLYIVGENVPAWEDR